MLRSNSRTPGRSNRGDETPLCAESGPTQTIRVEQAPPESIVVESDRLLCGAAFKKRPRSSQRAVDEACGIPQGQVVGMRVGGNKGVTAGGFDGQREHAEDLRQCGTDVIPSVSLDFAPEEDVAYHALRILAVCPE